MLLSPISEAILLAVHRGDSIRDIAKLIGVSSPNAVYERMKALEGGGYLLPPSRPGKHDRRLSAYGKEYMIAQGYIEE